MANGGGARQAMRRRPATDRSEIGVLFRPIMTKQPILKRLPHPNITKFKATFQHNRKFHIVMEYCAGGDLNDYIQKIKEKGLKIPEKDIMRWLKQLCDALHYIHSNHYIHRDIKLGNIFLTGDENEVKLGDFGVSKTLAYTSQLTVRVTGTQLYYAPEICQNKPYDYKVDTWGLGMVIYQLSKLEYPFKDITEVKEDKLEVNTKKLLAKQKESGYEPIPDHYSSGLGDLIQEMLQFDDEVRPLISSILKKPLLVQAAVEEKRRLDIELIYNIGLNRKVKTTVHEAAQFLNYLPEIRW
ncbi:unnamed protein product, partial [Meganyctiphanes norvegica]